GGGIGTASCGGGLGRAKGGRPWIPTAARRTAIAAKPPSTLTWTARGAVSAATISDSVRTLEIGCSGSAAFTIRRIAGRSWAGGTGARTARAFGGWAMIGAAAPRREGRDP